MEDVVSQAGPEVVLDAGQKKTQCGGTVSAFPPELIMNPQKSWIYICSTGRELDIDR